MKKKRKFQYEISGLPLPKHVCSVRSDFPSEQHPEKELNKWMDTSKDGIVETENQLDPRDSEKDSNIFSEDDNSVMSVSSDWPSTSSVNWGGSSSSTSFYSGNCRLETKSSESGGQQYLCEQKFANHNYEDQLLEYAKYVDCDSSEYGYDGIEVCKDNEFEDLVHSDGVSEKNFILSSGRWTVNQEAEQDTRKLTIDKEFEQYFSMLML